MFMMSRCTVSVFLLVCTLLILAVPASADPRTLGADFRRLLSNQHMVSDIARRCPELEMPAMVGRREVEKTMQEKIGTEPLAKLMHAIVTSPLRTDALATVEQLFEQVDGCEDERLSSAVVRISSVHAATWERFENSESLVAPQNVPVPLRRN